MAKVVPEGYSDLSIGITREGDPDPYMITMGGSLTALQSWAVMDHIEDCLDEHLRPHLLNVDRFSSIRLREGGEGNYVVYERNINLVGAGSQQAAPQNVAIICKKTTAFGGRHNQGRIFWPSVNEGAVDPVGQVNETLRSALEEGLNDFHAAMIDPNADASFQSLVIFHDESINQPPSEFTGFSVQPIVGTQRRRLRR